MASERVPLDREVVVRAALRVLDDVGLENLTLRRIAAVLDVQPPALYWHFANKQALVDEMATTMLRDLLRAGEQDAHQDAHQDEALGDPGGSWRPWLERMARGLRAGLLAHRDGGRVFSGTYLTDDAVLQAMEVPLARLTAAGFEVRDAVLAWRTVYLYTIGFVIEEQAVRPRPGEPDPRYDVAARAARVDAARFPLTAAAGPILFGAQDAFGHGLGLILDGLAPRRRT